MDLMIDIGNTHTVLGLFNDNNLEHYWRLSSTTLKTEDEIWVVITAFLKNINFDYNQIHGVAISSVVPDITILYDRMIEKYISKEALHISSDLDLGMAILYDNPNEVGADRICNSVAAKDKYGYPLIILDFGTATTFDCIDHNGNYAGGVICPGVESAASVLHHKAAKLPKIELEFPKNIIGKSTDKSMQSGIMFGFVEMINGIIDKIGAEMKIKPKVVATGGLANIIASRTNKISEIDPNLNLIGILRIYQKNIL